MNRILPMVLAITMVVGFATVAWSGGPERPVNAPPAQPVEKPSDPGDNPVGAPPSKGDVLQDLCDFLAAIGATAPFCEGNGD